MFEHSSSNPKRSNEMKVLPPSKLEAKLDELLQQTQAARADIAALK